MAITQPYSAILLKCYNNQLVNLMEKSNSVGNIHSTRFEYDQVLLGSRSPHVTIGNIWLPHNMKNDTIDKYVNLTNEIVCINSIGENVLQRFERKRL